MNKNTSMNKPEVTVFSVDESSEQLMKIVLSQIPKIEDFVNFVFSKNTEEITKGKYSFINSCDISDSSKAELELQKIRSRLSGSVFSQGYTIPGFPQLVPSWKKPIVVAYMPDSDQEHSTNLKISSGAKTSLQITNPDGTIQKFPLYSFKQPGILFSTFAESQKIASFAKECFEMGLNMKLNVFFSSKNTILKNYDGLFKDIFQEVFDKSYAQKFKDAKLTYEHRLIDDMVAFALKSSGDFLWACKSVDGEVESRFVSEATSRLGYSTRFFKEQNRFCVIGHQRTPGQAVDPPCFVYDLICLFNILGEEKISAMMRTALNYVLLHELQAVIKRETFFKVWVEKFQKLVQDSDTKL